MKHKALLVLEIVLLFVGIPAVFLLPIGVETKVTLFLLAIIYVIVIAVKDRKKKVFQGRTCNQIAIYKTILLRFLVIAIGTIAVLFFTNKEDLFNVISTKPLLWLQFSGVYILASVIPQELLYRSFFIKRYRLLFSNDNFFILINALLFSFGHIWFQSFTVLAFTFIGGILFTKTYLQSKSIYAVLIEHAFYGVWLYTVGYGELFLFPVK
jgi:membrane protease YdiL (CAAX protease family)